MAIEWRCASRQKREEQRRFHAHRAGDCAARRYDDFYEMMAILMRRAFPEDDFYHRDD